MKVVVMSSSLLQSVTFSQMYRDWTIRMEFRGSERIDLSEDYEDHVLSDMREEYRVLLHLNEDYEGILDDSDDLDHRFLVHEDDPHHIHASIYKGK